MNALLSIQVSVTGSAQADASKLKAQFSDLTAAAKDAASAVGSVGTAGSSYAKLTEQLASMQQQVAGLADRLSSLGKSANFSQMNSQLLSVQARLAALADAIAKVNDEGFSVKNFAGLASMSAGLQSSITGLTQSVGKAEEANTGWTGSMDKLFTSITNTGKQIQWVGRQIEDAFTKPILLAGGLAADFAIKQGEAFNQLANAYGTVGESASQTASDLALLDKGFTELSDTYGISKVVLDEVATDYAKAGAAGAQLAQDVQNVAQVMVITGNTSSDLATQLLGLQQAYHLNSQEMQNQIEQLVVLSKDAPGTFDQLAEAMRTSAGAAAEAGISMSQLGAFMVALTPAAGDLNTAGMAMRTIISRLMNPSKDYTALLNEMGINTGTVAWQSASATDKLLAMAQAMNQLTPAQKAAVDSAASSRFQIDRFSVLISDLEEPLGNYTKATKDASDQQKVFAQYTKELQTVLSSNPQAFKILWQQLQNALVQIIIPLMPAIEGVIGNIVRLADAFGRLSPQTQQFILLGVGLLAAVGPVVRYAGALLDLVGVFGRVALWPFRLAGLFDGLGEKFGGILKYPFQSLGNAMDPFIGSIRGASESLTELQANLDETVAATETAAAAMGEAMGSAFGAAGASATESTDAADAAIEEGWYSLIPVVDAVNEQISTAFAASATASTVAWVTAVDGTIIPILGELVAASAVAATTMATDFAAGSLLELTAGFTAAGALMAGEAGGVVATWSDAAVNILAIWTVTTDGVVTASTFMAAETDAAFLAMVEGATAAFAALDGAMGVAMVAITAEVSAGMAAVDGVIALGMAGAAGEMLALPAAAGVAITATATEVGVGAAAIGTEAAGGLAGVAAAIAGLFGPDEIALIVAGLLALGALIYAYWGNIQNWLGDFANWLVNTFTTAWGLLPTIVEDAINGVIRVLDASVGDVQDLLSYLNPFARHSPSLVDNVQNGLGVVSDEYSNLTGSGGVYEQAMGAHNDFVAATNPEPGSATQRKDIVKAYGSAAGVDYDAQIAQMARLSQLMATLTQDYDQQYTVVQQDSRALQANSLALKQAQDQLKLYQKQASDSDAMFANSEAQKKLQLQIDQLQDINGSYVNITQAAADYRGQLEMLEAKTKSLRDKGAGSDVLGGLEAQTAAVQGQQGDLMSRIDQMNQLSQQLAALQHQGDELSLQGAIMFDPMIRDQQKLVDSLTTSHDQLQASYDAENQKLTDLKNAYDGVNSAYSSMKSSLSTSASQAASANKSAGLDTTMKNFNTGALDQSAGAYGSAGSNLANLNAGNLQDLVDQWAKGAQKQLGNFDIFAPVKQKFEDIVTWLKTTGRAHLDAGVQAFLGALAIPFIGPLLAPIAGLAGLIFGPKFISSIEDALSSAFHTSIDFLVGIFDDVWHPMTQAWNAIGKTMTKAWNDTWNGIGRALQSVYNSVIHPIWTGIYTTADYTIIPVLRALGLVFSTVWNDVIAPALHIAWAIMKPILDAIAWVFVNVLPPVLETFGEIAQIVFYGLRDLIVLVWNVAIYPTLKALWKAIQDTGAVFSWLYDNIVKPVFGAIGTAIAFVWNNVLNPIFKAIQWTVQNVVAPVFTWLNANIIQPVWSTISSVISGTWNKGVLPVFNGINDFLKNTLGPAFTWLRDSVIKPVFNGIADAIWTVMSGVVSMLGSAVNDMIDLFNGITGAINWIGHNIPGVTISISAIPHVKWGNIGAPPHCATGGLLASEVGGGFTTSGPRAIVGEGNPLHTEYVVPTDPIHRRRALGLAASLMHDLGVPGYLAGGLLPNPIGAIETAGSAIGGAISDVGGFVSSIGGDVAGAVESGAADLGSAFVTGFDDTISAMKAVVNKGVDAMVDAGMAGLDHMIDHAPLINAWMKTDLKGFVSEVGGDIKSHFGGSPTIGQVAAPPSTLLAVYNQGLAKSMYPQWASGPEWVAWDNLWNKESGWNQFATNPSSGAYGIPQSLPADKMASAGADWRTNPATQITWGAGYIAGRYGDPVGAWGHETQYNWYAGGGALPLHIYDSGGDMPPGLGMFYNGTGRTEKVLTAEQAAGGGNRTYNFYGDLSFPNVENGDDAEAFVKNLESLA